MKKICILFIILIFMFCSYLLYTNRKVEISYLFSDNIINYINKNDDIILSLNETKNLNTTNIVNNSDIIKVKNETLIAKKLGTTNIKVNDKDVKVIVINNEKMLDIKNNLTPIFGPVKNEKLYMQNFDIDKDNIYISYTNASYIKTNNTCNSKKILDKINKVKVIKYKNNKKINEFIIKDSGHAQSFVYNEGYIWTTGDGYAYKDSLNRCWGKGKYLIKIKYKKNQTKSYDDANLIIKFYNYKGKKYHNPEISIDKSNKLVSIKLKDNIIIYKLKDFTNNINKPLYNFKIKTNIEEIYKNTNKIYNQGGQLYNGYYYQYLGAPNNDIYIIVYDMLGNIVKTIKYNLKSLGFEAEGIKIYNDNLYMGVTTRDKRNFIYKLN